MTRRPRSARRGATLILVLWLIVVLGSVAAGVAGAARTHTDVTANVRADAIARYAAESGIVAAVAALQRALDGVGDDVGARRALLNDPASVLPRDATGDATLRLGDGRAQVTIVDLNARLDVNLASEDALATLFTRVGVGGSAAEAARAIARDREARRRTAGPYRSLDELADVPGLPRAVLERAAADLTVDGDGQVNRASASPAVRAAAGGALRDEPSRLLLVSRGWQEGLPLTTEIQAVYAVEGSRLVFVRWRERSR